MGKPVSLILLVLLCLVRGSGGEKSVHVTVKNPGDIDRKVETIAVSLRGMGVVADRMGRVVVADEKTGATLLHQIDGDTLLFQSGFMPYEEKEFLITQSGDTGGASPSLVDGRFELPREDYAWENDRIAFRMYGPALAAEVNNGIDVWTKRVRYLIVDKWYRASAAAGKDTYHEDHGEGADFFSVGRSLGAGGCGIWLNGKVQQPGVFSSCRTIHNGPIRVTFELVYSNWNVNGKIITERMRISLDAGENLNRVELVAGSHGLNDSIQLACGLVKRSNTAASKDEDNRWLGLWGLTVADTVNGFLGTGIVSSPSSFIQFAEDRDQYLAIGQTRAGEPFVYYAGAGWTRSGDFATESDWKSYLNGFARRLLSPLKVTPHTN